MGDQVQIRLDADGTGYIEEILPRKNFLTRPPVANIDQLIIVTSVRSFPESPVDRRAVAAAEDKGIEPVVVVSKTDLQSGEWLREIYEKAGIPFFAVSSVTDEGVEAVKALLKGKITAFTGNSGVGKSSLLNRIDNRLALETGEISQKLGRGRHTTRKVELLKLDDSSYVANTPGFRPFPWNSAIWCAKKICSSVSANSNRIAMHVNFPPVRIPAKRDARYCRPLRTGRSIPPATPAMWRCITK